jgi:hypothetical protein
VSAEQIAFQITYASVDAGDGSDPTAATERILADQRVLAAVRGFDGEETVVLIPITESGDVVALGDDDLLRFELSASALGALFTAEGLTLQLGHEDDGLDDVDAELEQEYGEAFEQLDDQGNETDGLAGFGMPEYPEEFDGESFEAEPVRVAEFSRRAVWAARLTAQLLDTDVDYLEDGTWSVYRYRTGRAHGAIASGRADGPIIEVNVPQHGEAWIEITSNPGAPAMFWPNSERLTRPVIDLETITVLESAELYRRMLVEADGVREELAELRLDDAVDTDAVLRACMPEALGGIVGADARLRAFVTAFGVPESLAAAGLAKTGAGRRFTPRGWLPMVGSVLMGGLAEITPLTQRATPLARLGRLLRKRPMLHGALSVGELSAGVALSRSRSLLGRGFGILLVVDALVDLAILWVRLFGRR